MQKFYLFWFVFCSKYSTAPGRVAQQTQILTTVDWQLSDHHNGPYDIMQPCNQDDQIRFLTDVSGQKLQGLVKCHPSDPDSVHLALRFFDRDAYILQFNETDYKVSYLDQHLEKFQTLNIQPWYSLNIYDYIK